MSRFKYAGQEFIVTEVADCFAKNNKKLTIIKLGGNIKKIGREAFSGCKNLERVDFNNRKQLTDIGTKAFYGCKSLTKLTITDQVSRIGSQAFCNCKGLETITIKSTKLSASNVGAKAFAGIKKTVTVKVPKAKKKAYKKWLVKKGLKKSAKIK